MSTLSILVVTHNHDSEIADCLAAAHRQRDDIDIDLVVVDSGSSDDTVARAKAGGADRVVALRHNVGYALASNVAFDLASGPYVMLLNPDCEPDDGCAGVLIEHLERNPTAGVAAALLRNPDGTPQRFARRQLSPSSVGWCLTYLGRKLDGRLRGGKADRRRCYADLIDAPATEPFAVDTAAAACVLLRRADVGPRLFDPRFPLFFNDTDLYASLGERSLRCEVVPRAGAVHGYGTSIRRVPAEQMRAEYVRSLRRFAATRWRRADRAALIALLVLDAASAALYGLVRRDRDARLHSAGTLGGLGVASAARPWIDETLPVDALVQSPR